MSPKLHFKEMYKHDFNDNINHPQHYTDGAIETWDYIEDKRLNYNLGNACKYISRAGKKVKGTYVDDLQKAIAYLEREISMYKIGRRKEL